MTIEPITRCAVIGPGSKTFFKTNTIKSIKVKMERISSAITTKGVVEKTFIQEKITNNVGIIEIRRACLFVVANEKIPAKRKSIQKTFKTDIINE